MSHLNLSTAMTNLEVFRGLEVTFSYFISWNVFEYWKILGINNKDIRARPNYAVQSSSPAVAHGHRPNAFTMRAQTCLKPTALLGPKLPQSSRFCAALVRPCALTYSAALPEQHSINEASHLFLPCEAKFSPHLALRLCYAPLLTAAPLRRAAADKRLLERPKVIAASSCPDAERPPTKTSP
jgi:hypothetical protein